MMTPQQRAIIKSTVPLLETGGEALTRHFYQLMFSEYPQVRVLFNQAHQASGDQQRALANAVLMYAKHLDHLEALGPLVNQIVNKHVALQILPEHYPIVGTCLLRAIREVLGEEIATDEVIEAWGLAYGMLADILIGAEESAYQANEQAEGGWRGARTFTLARKVAECEEIVSLYFVPADGGAVVAYQPGQYIGMKLEIDGEEVRRNYSLSALSDGKQYRISVKREAQGRVSNYLHDTLQVGDSIELFAPAGDFVLQPSSRPIALITAGVGITPAVAMVEAAKNSGRPIHFIHCARNGSVHAFKNWIESVTAAHPQVRYYVSYSEPQAADECDASGFLTRECLGNWLPQDRNIDAYFLGPKPFMAMVKRHLSELGVPTGQCHYEFFGPASALDA
ncbi:NO-inducible flavohemoprotein [Pseudomonas sp. MS19]|uniref:NO-inducible flavohemoprotein n=1 Tax=Pseudomonas sp. MS19 TaxID=2579939 RepID=UPI001562402C|nr:NO-inducible flavohemoprotein [Pseudomonas sp. MS19]NRH26635.1 NO-inducible flavohemoprotein [Pseudomonas sp. MS19]